MEVSVRTIGQAIQKTRQEPFTFLAKELRIIVCCILSSGLAFTVRNGKDILAFGITKGYMDMSAMTG